MQQLPRKILDGERFVQRFSDDLTQLFLVGFKACRLGGLAPCGKGGVFPIQRRLSPFLRPILALGDAVCAAVQKVDLIKPGFVAQLHDLGFEIFHRRVSAAMLTSGFGVRWSVHVRQKRHIFDPQTVDDDIKLLRLIHGQPVVRAIPWVKADDVVMAFDILALLIFAKAARSKAAARTSAASWG